MPASPHATSAHSASLVSKESRAALLAWFHAARAKRMMPWRRLPPDGQSRGEYRKRLAEDGRLGQWAYEVMIAEVMLQQTQVATVIPYFQRWMSKYPTIQDLAAGSQEEVHALWSGLGYYSRATRLLLAAQKVVDEYAGNLPSEPRDLEKNVPGVGPYTAGAISSIVYGNNVPLVDGNVQRVLSRILGVYADPKSKAFNTLIWSLAKDLVEQVEDGSGGCWNEGLMELGATICRPTDAKCGECPVSASCVAFQEVTTGSSSKGAEVDMEDLCTTCEQVPQEEKAKGVCTYPMKAAKKRPREEDTQVTVLEWRAKGEEDEEGLFLVVKRPEKGLLAGLYEFPSHPYPEETPSSSSFDAAVVTFVSSLLPAKARLPPPKQIVHRGIVRHQFSHISMAYHVSHMVVCATSAAAPPDVARGRWVDRTMLEGDGKEVDVNMGTGGKKCWALVWSEASAKKPAGKKRAPASGSGGAKKEAPLEKGQAKLSSSFFGGGALKKRKALDEDASAAQAASAVPVAAESTQAKAQKQARVRSEVVKKRTTIILSDDDDDEAEVIP